MLRLRVKEIEKMGKNTLQENLLWFERSELKTELETKMVKTACEIDPTTAERERERERGESCS